LWPGQDALHKRFQIVQRPMLFEVVAVVATAVVNQVGEDPTPMIYRPIQQDYSTFAALLVRGKGDPEALIAAVRDQVQTLDRRIPLRGTGTVRQNIDAGLWAPRMGAALLSIFGPRAAARDDRSLRRDVVHRDAARPGNRDPHGLGGRRRRRAAARAEAGHGA